MLKRYTELHEVIRGVYLVQVRENAPRGNEKHRLVAQEVAHGKRKAQQAERDLWARYADPTINPREEADDV